ncbi:hypothetical protein CA54_56980 [Symmachiella macrocystis]|uniref:Uncharacterized protein n=1 Tax=Symmachiella macrocystis TaxID=2527985 RepID=A0A5C6B554_9PLAN|nr:hypothetical protein [Symmachiella macrocystis]TWU07293.1 hypothetical protein CA54_56980 [Symmachiella macrocystis]
MRLLNRCMGGVLLVAALSHAALAADEPAPLSLSWQKNMLTISGAHLPGGPLKIHYIEAYCRPGSTDRDWRETTIQHETQQIDAAKDGSRLQLQCRLADGVIVQHDIRALADNIDFQITATNPTQKPSLAYWAQPCLRVDRFTGRNQKTYLDKGFVFYNGQLTRMPTSDWATKARYVPGQVWAPRHVDRNDVNPRPLNDTVPSNGLIGCFSADESMILATAFEPYQELFQGVIVCLHSDFRIGGLKPGETKQIRGKIYILKNDIGELLRRYRKDFPEHHKPSGNKQ